MSRSLFLSRYLNSERLKYSPGFEAVMLIVMLVIVSFMLSCCCHVSHASPPLLFGVLVSRFW